MSSGSACRVQGREKCKASNVLRVVADEWLREREKERESVGGGGEG